MSNAEDMEIILGTYEQFLLGYKINNTLDGYKLVRSFVTHSHQASIRDVANSKHYLASAGADDTINIYDMKNRIETGRLTHHNDTVNGIAFTPDSSHLLTCSSDGSIAAVRRGNWILEKHWKNAHKGFAVNCLSVHPTGKLALSIGRDGVLRTWNLIKGRQAYATNLLPKLGYDAKNICLLKWSPEGGKYMLATNFKICLYSVEQAGIINEAQFEERITCIEFIDETLIMIGQENGQIVLYDAENSEKLYSQVAHDARVKAVVCANNIIGTASSSGELKLWQYKKRRLNLLATENCGARITCMILSKDCEEEIVRKEITEINDEAPVKTKNVFKIQQQVIIEDEDDEQEKKKSQQKKLKRKAKPKSKSKSKLISINGTEESSIKLPRKRIKKSPRNT